MQAIHRQRLVTAVAGLFLTLTPACSSGGAKRPDPKKLIEVYRETALSYFDLGDYLRAEAQISKGLDLDPKEPMLLLMLGWVRQRRGSREDIQVAEKVFRELAPKGDYRAWLGLAQSLERKGVNLSESAVGVETGRLTTRSEDPAARAAEMRAQAQAAWRESLSWYRRVLEKRPSEPQTLNGLMRVHALLNEPAESLAYADQLLDQTYGEVAFWRKQLERPELSAEEEARLRRDVRDTEVLQVSIHLHAATLRMQNGNDGAALDHLDRALALDPSRADIHSRRAQLLARLGRNEEAIAEVDEFLRLSQLAFDHPDVQAAYQLRSRCEDELRSGPSTAR